MAEQEQDKLLIRLHVYDTDLSVRIPREDEEYYRKSAKLIDDIVNSYTKIFKGRKSDKEILYMALIDVSAYSQCQIPYCYTCGLLYAACGITVPHKSLIWILQTAPANYAYHVLFTLNDSLWV